MVFSAANGNAIAISDIDAGTNSVQVALTATNGTLTLNGTTGLIFNTGDGTADATMTFTGTVTDINSAINGMSFTPTNGYTGSATLQIVTNDQGNSGSGGARSDTDLVSISVNSASLWISSKDNSTVPPASGGISWTDGEVIKFSDPNLALDPGTTSGTFSTVFDLDSFTQDGNGDVNALHYVTHTVTVGSGGSTVTLQAGDVLLSTGTNETLGGVAVTTRDVILFRPTTPDNYSSGTFSVLLRDPGATGKDIWGIALVETNTIIGDATLSAGEFLLTLQGATYERSVWRFTPTGVGAGTTTGTLTELIDGNNLNISQGLSSVELVQQTTILGDITLQPGQILLTVDTDDSSVGTNNIAVKKYDIFLLNVTATGVGTTAATATLLFEGGDVGISAGGEEFDAIALVSTAAVNDAPVNTVPGAQTVNEDTALAHRRDQRHGRGRQLAPCSWRWPTAR